MEAVEHMQCLFVPVTVTSKDRVAPKPRTPASAARRVTV
jgi:hypothetical protein